MCDVLGLISYLVKIAMFTPRYLTALHMYLFGVSPSDAVFYAVGCRTKSCAKRLKVIVRRVSEFRCKDRFLCLVIPVVIDTVPKLVDGGVCAVCGQSVCDSGVLGVFASLAAINHLQYHSDVVELYIARVIDRLRRALYNC